MKVLFKKGLVTVTALTLIFCLFQFKGQITAWGMQAADFSATFMLTDGFFWKKFTATTPVPQEAEEEASLAEQTPSEQTEQAPQPLSPTPPEGVKTGTVQTQTLSLSAANTVADRVHISNKTGLTLKPEGYLSQGMPFSLADTDQPQVLIVHTHATECYLDGDYGYYIQSASTRSTDNTKNTVRVGDVLASVLNEAGIVTINDATQHDYPNYTGSYTRSADTIHKYLEKHPSIQVVIDLHRDAIGGSDNVKVKPTAVINGKKAAQVMILAGCETGSVENFPNWQENLRFCLQLQRQMETDYEGLARPLLFKACKYNFDICPGSILVEVGTDANTLEEAEYSATLLGKSLIQILKPV